MKLNHNYLHGDIPVNIGNLEKLELLRFDNNFLSGEIPLSIGELEKLSGLYLLNNNLSGQVPNGICTIYEKNENFRSYLHNNNLCPGESGHPTCIPNDHLGPQSCPP